MTGRDLIHSFSSMSSSCLAHLEQPGACGALGSLLQGAHSLREQTAGKELTILSQSPPRNYENDLFPCASKDRALALARNTQSLKEKPKAQQSWRSRSA